MTVRSAHSLFRQGNAAAARPTKEAELMRVTKEVADILNLTFDEAIREHHEYVTPELLLYA